MSKGTQGDRTEKPTAKRKRDARERGQVARSRDLAGALSLASVALALGWFGPRMVRTVSARLVDGLQNLGSNAHVELNANSLATTAWSDLGLLAVVVTPLAFVAATVSIGASLAQTGWAISPKALHLNWSKISPSQGFSRFAPMQAGTELLKAL